MANQYTPKRKAIFPIGPSIAYIPLTKGQFALVDWDIAFSLEKWNWHAQWSPEGEYFYAIRRIPSGDKQGVMLMHREILDISGFTGDHKNRNTLDNRISNLRPATHSQQMMNRRLFKNNKTGYKGVTINRGKYMVGIKIEGKMKFLGRFDQLEDAVMVRKEAEEKWYGEYASVIS